MRRSVAAKRAKRAGQFVADALAGRLGVLLMTMSYALLAVVLLGYVSTHVYTSSLMEDVAARDRERRELKERIGRLTTQYASLSSRARISSYCEERLGMVEAGVTHVTRVRIEAGQSRRVSEFAESDPAGISVRDVLGSHYGDLSRVMQKEAR